MALVVRFPDILRAEREYAAHVVFKEHLGLAHKVVFEDRRDVLVHPVGDLTRTVCLPDFVFADGEANWPASARRPETIAEEVRSHPGEPGTRLAADTPGTDSHTKFSADVFGTVFWYLTRLEEILSPVRDSHGRFPADASVDENQRPCVDLLIDAFGRLLVETWPALRTRTHAYDFVPTHDVDRPFKHLFQRPPKLLRGMARDALVGGRAGAALRAPFLRHSIRRGKLELDPFNTFDWLMDLSERHNKRSLFYFICGKGDSGIDGDYRIDDPSIRALLRRVHARGHGIGLHGSYQSAFDSTLLAREVHALRRICEQERITLDRVRLRQHVLRFEPTRTVSVWAEAAIDEDSTLGHAGQAGFRCGTCRSFPLFDVRRRSMTNVVERPLVAMDVTLLERRYEGLPYAAALGRINGLASQCRLSGGSFVLLWHNCQLEDRGARQTYAEAFAAAAATIEPCHSSSLILTSQA